jgi:small subunit ribosomal protein S9
MVKEEKTEEDKKKKIKTKKTSKTESKAEVQKSGAPKLEAKTEPAPEKTVETTTKPTPKKKKSSPKKQSKKVFIARGKRKESVARATISEGKGKVFVNRHSVASIPNSYVREIIVEPLRYVGPEANNVNISVNVTGGGVMGQAQAARTAIANALVLYFDQMNLKHKFTEIDRSLIVEDTRRVEPKKYRGPKARARFQKSYR